MKKTNKEQKQDDSKELGSEVVKVDFNQLKDGLSGFVRGTVEEALNGLLEAEAEELVAKLSAKLRDRPIVSFKEGNKAAHKSWI